MTSSSSDGADGAESDGVTVLGEGDKPDRVEDVEEFDSDEVMARRAADYVRAVLDSLDELPVVFAQRRSDSFLGRVTMPGNRQLTQLFVRRQLTVTLRRLKAETGLRETAGKGASDTAGKLSVLVEAVGAKTSTVVPIAIVLGLIGVLVSFLSIVLPDLQQEADLLGSLPRVVMLDGAAVADNATAFDGNPAVFSPLDLEGVFDSLLLASVVIFLLFSILSGSAHAAASILDDPWRYHPMRPFQPSVRRGPVPTQVAVFATKPSQIHTPIAADLIRNASLYVLVLMSLVVRLIREFAGRDSGFVEYERSGGAEIMWTFVWISFPAGFLIAYLVIRHRRQSDGTGAAPPAGWRIAIGAAIAGAAGAAIVGSATWAAGVRLTPGADLVVYLEEFYLTAEDLQDLREIPGIEVQSFAWYPVDVEVSDGLVAVDLLATELATVANFLTAEIDDEALTTLRQNADKVATIDERLPVVWVSDGLAAVLDRSTGDTIRIPVDESPTFEARADLVFQPAGDEPPLVVVDVEDLPASVELLIDEVFVRSSSGPLRNDDTAWVRLNDLLEAMPDSGVDDLRRELFYDAEEASGGLLIGPIALVAAFLTAFGRPWRWGKKTHHPAPPALPRDADLAAPVAAGLAPPAEATEL